MVVWPGAPSISLMEDCEGAANCALDEKEYVIRFMRQMRERNRIVKALTITLQWWLKKNSGR